MYTIPTIIKILIAAIPLKLILYELTL